MNEGEHGRIGIFYEHPDWFAPLFDELARRGVPHERIDAAAHRFDPAAVETYALVLNRMSPSAYLRGAADAIFYTGAYLTHLERLGTRVVNGSAAWAMEISKARQLSLLESLRLPYPKARVIHRAADAPEAAEGLRFPVVVKPNIGGSGAGVRRFDSPVELEAAAAAPGSLDLGLDHTGLVQEYVLPEADRIVRVEVLDGAFLYAIRIYTDGSDFNLCPADVCLDADGTRLARATCAADEHVNDLRVEGYEPPPEVRADVERITAAAGIEVGGVEYVVDRRDGRRYYYDVNALSNFVADAPRVIGFDPFVNLADWLEREAGVLAAGAV